jgi:hypothetical protein
VAPRERTKPRNGERSSSGSGAKTRLAGSGVRVQGSLGFHEEDVCGGPVTEWAEIWPMVGRKLPAHQVGGCLRWTSYGMGRDLAHGRKKAFGPSSSKPQPVVLISH